MKQNNAPRIGGISVTKKGIRPHRGDIKKSGLPEYGTILFTNQKAGTVTTNHQSHIFEDASCVASVDRNTAPDGGIEQHIEPCPEMGETNCVATAAKDNLILQRPRGKNKGGFYIEKSPTISANAWQENNLAVELSTKQLNPSGESNSWCIRRLTPTECARLQTVPDWYKWVVSETQQYKMLGNGWTVEVIKHIFSFLPDRFKQ